MSDESANSYDQLFQFINVYFLLKILCGSLVKYFNSKLLGVKEHSGGN